MSSAIEKSRSRTVHLHADKRGCLYCLGNDGPFTGQEHAIPAGFGANTADFVLAPGAVCDPCNHFLGRQVDGPFLGRFDMRLARALEGAKGRGGVIDMIEGRPPHTALLDIDVGDGHVRMHAAELQDDENGTFFEIRPKDRDPADIVKRSVRALWKMALANICREDPERALDAKWDPIRGAVLGHDFKGYLLSRQFMAIRTQRLDLAVDITDPQQPLGVHFRYGGVELAVPLLPGRQISQEEVAANGFEVQLTTERPPDVIRLQLDPNG